MESNYKFHINDFIWLADQKLLVMRKPYQWGSLPANFIVEGFYYDVLFGTYDNATNGNYVEYSPLEYRAYQENSPSLVFGKMKANIPYVGR
jgi:hypothetical protein